MVLAPLQHVSDYLQTQEVPTMGVIFPVMQGLLTQHLDTTEALEARRMSEPTLPPITSFENFKALVGDHIKNRFDETLAVWEKEILLSILLDPRSKDFYFINEESRRTKSS